MKQEVECWNCGYKGMLNIINIKTKNVVLRRAICPTCKAVIIIGANRR